MKKITFVSMLCFSLMAHASSTQVNRYATVENKPSTAQINPMLTVQHIHFPKNIITIGDAINYWMQYSGYQLVTEQERSAVFKNTLKQPLPQIQRDLGPLSIQEGLRVLAGFHVYDIVQNPLNRTVNFKLKTPHKDIKHA